MSELEDLIASQAKDLRMGNYQPPEHMAWTRLSALFDEGVLGDIATAPVTLRRPRTPSPDCARHGQEFWRVTPKGRGYCTKCRSEYGKRWRARVDA